MGPATTALDRTLTEWLQRIERLHAKPIDLGLERVHAVAARLDLRLPLAIVVGGTNGKGSTCAMLESILRSAGYRAGLYTSPHLLEFNERAKLNGIDAGDEALIEQFEAVESARRGTSLTYFEFTTLAILRLFTQAKLDAVVLEVGLGGRLDAVNIVDAAQPRALVELEQMRRGVQTDTVARGPQDAVEHRAGRTLAIGATNDDRERRSQLQPLRHCAHPFEPEIDRLRMQPLNALQPFGQRAIQSRRCRTRRGRRPRPVTRPAPPNIN